MGKQHSRLSAMLRTTRWLTIGGLLLSLLAVGCADTGGAESDKRGGFYGGIFGGGARP